MEKIIKKINSPGNLDSNWDNLADFYFQKRKFLTHLHKYNACAQRYYELYCDNRLVAGAVVYTLRINILTFANIPSPLRFQVIGLPVSIAAPPIIGDYREYEYLLSELIKLESGIILGLNFLQDFLTNKVLNLRTLPTILLKLKVDKIENYENSLRHAYRRRIHRIRQKFLNVTSVTSDCKVFNEKHYALYLEIMRKTTTKLETLSFESFKNLPPDFQLTTYYIDNVMLCWHILLKDVNVLFFYFGGMNYSLRDKYQSYNNNLLGILSSAVDQKFNLIDLGQTAETAKTRLGGELSERRMFLYHKNPLIFGVIRIFRKLISYTKTIKSCHVFKFEN